MDQTLQQSLVSDGQADNLDRCHLALDDCKLPYAVR